MRSLTLLTPLLYSLALADEAKSKRGLAYIGDSHASDNDLLSSAESPISWYYTWSLWRAPVVEDRITFVPLVPSPKDAADDGFGDRLAALPASSTHLLTFNEPDGTTESGGSSLTPEDAARAYVEHIAPLRDAGGRAWKISHPSVTGSPRGLDWLRDFNASCWDLDGDRGCPTDFVAVHWYGNFEGLAGWLDQLRDFYHGGGGETSPAFWVTEVALAQQDEEATKAMMNQTLTHLDAADDVEGYAWFGAFRRDEANAWTGDAVSLFDDDGGLTDLGALYLGGAGQGFDEGQKGPGADDDEDDAASLLALSRWGAAAAGLAAAWVVLL